MQKGLLFAREHEPKHATVFTVDTFLGAPVYEAFAVHNVPFMVIWVFTHLNLKV
jgi:hypothetical protein